MGVNEDCGIPVIWWNKIMTTSELSLGTAQILTAMMCVLRSTRKYIPYYVISTVIIWLVFQAYWTVVGYKYYNSADNLCDQHGTWWED